MRKFVFAASAAVFMVSSSVAQAQDAGSVPQEGDPSFSSTAQEMDARKEESDRKEQEARAAAKALHSVAKQQHSASEDALYEAEVTAEPPFHINPGFYLQGSVWIKAPPVGVAICGMPGVAITRSIIVGADVCWSQDNEKGHWASWGAGFIARYKGAYMGLGIEVTGGVEISNLFADVLNDDAYRYDRWSSVYGQLAVGPMHRVGKSIWFSHQMVIRIKPDAPLDGEPVNARPDNDPWRSVTGGFRFVIHN